MKIAVISTPIFPCIPPNGTIGYGGLEPIAWQLAKGLAEKGHQVALVAPEGSNCHNVTIIPNKPIRITQTGQPWDEKLAYGGDGKDFGGYWKFLTEFDCVVDHSWSKWAYVLKQEGVLKAPVLGVLHAPVNTMMQTLPAIDKPCFVCISEDQGAHFRALFSRDCRVAYNGVDSENFYKPLGLKRSGRFLFLARFSTIKGPLLGIEACKKAGVGLDLIGDTQITNEPEYLEQCKKACDGKQIRMIGSVTRGETVYWYSQARALIHPVRDFREPFGLAPVEAMACGCPVVSWNNGAMRETVEHGATGYLVQSMDELVESVKHARMWNGEAEEALRTQSREQAKKFNVEKMCARYATLCEEAIQTGGW